MGQQCLFSANLKFLRERKAQSQEKLSATLNITRSQLSAYEKGQTKNPTLDILIKVSDHFKISIDILIKTDLVNVAEQKLREYETRKNNDISGKELRVIVTTVDQTGKQNIEHVPMKARAGYLTGYGDPDYINKLPVFSLPHLFKDRKLRSFQCEGDSMFPFPENAIVVGEFIDNWFSVKEQVNCIVVTKSEGIVFKSVSNRIEQRRTFLLQSLNAEYLPYEVSIDEVCELWKFTCYISDEMPTEKDPLAKMESNIEEMRSDIKCLLKANKMARNN